MSFKVPESKKSIKQNRFEFEIDGKTYDVPKLRYLDGALVDMLVLAEDKGGIHETAANYAIFGPPDSPIGKAVRTLDGEQMSALLEAYQEDSRVTTGESGASTDS